MKRPVRTLALGLLAVVVSLVGFLLQPQRQPNVAAKRLEAAQVLEPPITLGVTTLWCPLSPSEFRLPTSRLLERTMTCTSTSGRSHGVCTTTVLIVAAGPTIRINCHSRLDKNSLWVKYSGSR